MNNYGQYVELDSESVAAVIEGDCVRLCDWRGGAPELGQIVGVSRLAECRRPVWLCCVEGLHADSMLIDVNCAIGEASAAVWYGSATWGDMYNKTLGVGDTGPAGYDVFGVLPNSLRGPPVTVSNDYVVIPRLRMFVPPPYRRHYCWLGERMVNGGF